MSPLFRIANMVRCTLAALIAITLLIIGCARPSHSPDPLQGWSLSQSQEPANYDKRIVNDYQDYIQHLPPNERRYVNRFNIWFFDNKTEQHAVKIRIPLNGVWREHILIYDRDGKRTDTVDHAGSRYAS
jgi:hypothetical protein